MKIMTLKPGRYYIIGKVELEVYVIRNIDIDKVEVEAFSGDESFNIQKHRLYYTKELKQIRL